MIKKIIVCGDSFCSADHYRPGTHFSELLMNYGHEVINLARGGISNTGICFQIERAITLNPDIIIFSSTGSDRIDVPVKNRKFDPRAGLKNFIYPYLCDSSTGTKYVGGLDAPIMSDVIPAFLNPRPDLLEVQIDTEIVKIYITHFHDIELKKKTDSWMIEYWKLILKQKSIPFIHLHMNGPIGQSMYQYVKNNPTKTNQCVYHTDEKTQIEITNELIKELAQQVTGN